MGDTNKEAATLGLLVDQAAVRFDLASPTRLQVNIALLKAIYSSAPSIHADHLIQFGAFGLEAIETDRLRDLEPGEEGNFTAYLIPSGMVAEQVRATRKAGVIIARDTESPDELDDAEVAQAYMPIEMVASLFPREDVVSAENLTTPESVNNYFLPKLEDLGQRSTQSVEEHQQLQQIYQDLEGLWIGLAREGRLADLEDVMEAYAGEVHTGEDVSSIATFIGRERFISLDPLREAWIAYRVGRALGNASFGDFSTRDTDLAAFIAAYEFLIEKFTTRSPEVLGEVLLPALMTARKGLSEEGIDEKMYEYIKTTRGLTIANKVKKIWNKKFASTESE